MENVVDCLFGIGLYQFLLHICIVILVMFPLLEGKILKFVVLQLLFFVLMIHVVYFYCEYRVVRGFFLLSKLYVS